VCVAQLHTQVEWLKGQFGALRSSWEEGHVKIKVQADEPFTARCLSSLNALKVRRSNVLQDSMDAIESIEKDDMRKLFRCEVEALPIL
jgi:hypothetical protein